MHKKLALGHIKLTLGTSEATDRYQSMKKIDLVAIKIVQNVAGYQTGQVGYKINMKYKT